MTRISAARNMCGYLSGLSSPSVTDSNDHLGPLAEIEQGRADEIADILDQHHRARAAASIRQGRAHHVGVEVAAGAGIDLHRTAPAARMRAASVAVA